MQRTNPYDVDRTFPAYFHEHRRMTVDRQGTYRCGEHPVWTVHCPLGQLGNSIIIEGDDALIVYDTGASREIGAHVASEIAKISDKPVAAVFYSHHHADHYNGTSAIVDRADVATGRTAIYAWENFEAERISEVGDIRYRQAMGALYYSGALLPPEEQHHHGIGLATLPGTAGFIPPTHTLSGDSTLTIAGIELRIFHTGGEAISEFGIHLPQFDIVLIADEFFTGLPNLHTIRGSKPRLPGNYTAALDRVLEIRPQWLVGSHIEPIEGREFIAETVTRYRDATQYLWDQSVRLINQGYTPVELQHALKDLPAHLYDPPYTVPVYGTPFTSVPEFFTGWVSWFSGDATDLFPSEPRWRAQRFVALMGGSDRVLDAAKTAHAEGDHQFAAELAQLVVRAEPENTDAKLVKAAALRARGYQEINAIARSWYLTGALELEGAIDPGRAMRRLATRLSAEATGREVVSSWRYRLDAQAAGNRRLCVGLRFTDTGEELTVRTRNSVLLLSDGIADDAEAVVELTVPAAKADELPTALAGDDVAVRALHGLLDPAPTGFWMHQR